MWIRRIVRKASPLVRLYSMGRQGLGVANDRYYGIDTESIDAFRYKAACADGVWYEPAPYWILRRLIRALATTPDDVFFDVGCGKGRALSLFGRLPIKQCIGVEIDPALAEVAAKNARTVRGRVAPIEVRLQNAVDADYSYGTTFFFYNPFGPETLSAVLTRIRESLERYPRKIRVVYYNPLHVEVLQNVLGLTPTVRTLRRFPRKPQKVAIATNAAEYDRAR